MNLLIFCFLYNYFYFFLIFLVCECNVYGSEHIICNPYSGACKCRPNVIGLHCDKCKPGFWNIQSKEGCEKCNCTRDGSLQSKCDEYTGQCACKVGIGGVNCDHCLEGYYGYSHKGCKSMNFIFFFLNIYYKLNNLFIYIECEACPSSVHICESETGRCICPPKSQGSECQQCISNTWGWEFRKGCKDCECLQPGSIGQSCDVITGQCNCREGYTGQNCNKCAKGYFNYPDCKKCSCDIRGSLSEDCDEKGQCYCKENVRGIKCNKCLATTFGLSKDNPKGCLPCFCFGRSNECVSSILSWGQIRLPLSRNLNINYLQNFNQDDDQQYDIVLQTENNSANRQDLEIKELNGLVLIPNLAGNVSITTSHPYNVPLYFQLPSQFHGDLINSYSGYLNFTLTSEGCSEIHPEHILNHFPLIQIHSHENFILDYYGVRFFFYK